MKTFPFYEMLRVWLWDRASGTLAVRVLPLPKAEPEPEYPGDPDFTDIIEYFYGS